MSKWKEWKESLGDSRPWHILDPSRHLEDFSISEKRLDICKSCDRFNQLTKQCKECGCVMPAKVLLSNAECPIGKWGKEEGK